MNNDIDILKKRLIYRAQYRGIKEMDKLIYSFVKSIIDELNVNQLHDLEIFLDIDDDTLYKFYNNQTIDKNVCSSEIFTFFKSFKYKK